MILSVFFAFQMMSSEVADKFVEECNTEFKDRYTSKDQEYDRVCKNLEHGGQVPPVIQPFRHHHDHDHHRRHQNHGHRDHHHRRH